MAVNTLAAPTFVGQTIEENGVSFISFDGVTWSLYHSNEDNIEDAAQRAELLVAANPIPIRTGTNGAGDTYLVHSDGVISAYRLLQTTPSFRNIYSLTQPV